MEILLFLALAFTLLYWYVTKQFGYFKKMGVPEDSASFPFGSDVSWKVWTGKESGLKSQSDINGKFTNERFWGMYTFGKPILVINDVELGKQILVKDADHFVDRMPIGLSYADSRCEADKIFAMFLSNMSGDGWKRMRNMATPVFTSGKLKLMVPHIHKVDNTFLLPQFLLHFYNFPHCMSAFSVCSEYGRDVGGVCQDRGNSRCQTDVWKVCPGCHRYLRIWYRVKQLQGAR